MSQLCAGHESGCEAAVHAMTHFLNHPSNGAIILVDAFNSLNRQVALRNVVTLLPTLATILINTYRVNIDLFIDRESILSQEGVTQGDPLAMTMYAISTIALIRQLSHENFVQVWYADDASASGRLQSIRMWWDKQYSMALRMGTSLKLWLIVKDAKLSEAHTIFQGFGIPITSEGKHYHGAAIGSESFVNSYVSEKVSEWITEIELLSEISLTQPHSAYAAFINSWFIKYMDIYFQNNTQPLLQPLEDAISKSFLPRLTGQNTFNCQLRDLLPLSARLGGLSIIKLVDQSQLIFDNSTRLTRPLVDLILQQSTFLPFESKKLNLLLDVRYIMR